VGVLSGIQPDGRIQVSGGDDGSVRQWIAQTETLLESEYAFEDHFVVLMFNFARVDCHLPVFQLAAHLSASAGRISLAPPHAHA
jgi:hypothetical protein